MLSLGKGYIIGASQVGPLSHALSRCAVLPWFVVQTYEKEKAAQGAFF